MPHRNALDLDSSHNTAIRAEIANRLRVLLSKEQPSPSPRIQHSLDCLNALDATEADLAIGGLSWRPSLRRQRAGAPSLVRCKP
jgi:hypothetical protein